jgi:hypothetical protein
MANVARNYGNERNIGEVLSKDGSLFTTIKAGFFEKNIGLTQRDDEGYDITVKNFKTNENIVVGRTFPKKDKEGNVIEFVEQTTLGLFKTYDKELNKEIIDKNDALFLEIVFLKEPKVINDTLSKVAFVKGTFGVEVASED